MPNTAKRALPYPAATAAPDVPTAIQLLAEKVDTELDALQPVPITITPANGIDWTGARVERVGRRMFFDGNVFRASDIPAGLLATTLPVEQRPLMDQIIPAIALTTGFNPTPVTMTVNKDGRVLLNFINAPSGTRYQSFSFSYRLAT